MDTMGQIAVDPRLGRLGHTHFGTPQCRTFDACLRPIGKAPSASSSGPQNARFAACAFPPYLWRCVASLVAYYYISTTHDDEARGRTRLAPLGVQMERLQRMVAHLIVYCAQFGDVARILWPVRFHGLACRRDAQQRGFMPKKSASRMPNAKREKVSQE